MKDNAVGIVGLGIMGSAWYGHLLDAGYDVVGYDPVASKVENLQQVGGSGATSPAEVARRTPVLITSLDHAGALTDVVEGVHGIAGADVGNELIVIETSTFPLETKRSARDRLEQVGITMLDCTISGTGHQARQRDIALYASGDPDALAPIVVSLGSTPAPVGLRLPDGSWLGLGVFLQELMRVGLTYC